MSDIKAQLDYSLKVDCPKCQSSFDLLDQEEDREFSIPLFNNRWDEFKGKHVICPKCDEEFTLDGCEY